MLGFIPGESADDNKESMIESMSGVATGEITYAVRDTVIDDHEIKEGNIMGIGDDGILAVGEDLEATTIEMIENMVDEDSGMISVYYGEDVKEEDANKLVEKLEKKFPDVEVECYMGGQPVYYYITSVE